MELVQEPSVQRTLPTTSILPTPETGLPRNTFPWLIWKMPEVHTGILWEIDHNGSWHWEIGDQNGHFYLALGGPNELYSTLVQESEAGRAYSPPYRPQSVSPAPVLTMRWVRLPNTAGRSAEKIRIMKSCLSFSTTI